LCLRHKLGYLALRLLLRRRLLLLHFLWRKIWQWSWLLGRVFLHR
jgi:hypothetical protein